jgi:hypothetical protein
LLQKEKKKKELNYSQLLTGVMKKKGKKGIFEKEEEQETEARKEERKPAS